MKLCSAITPKQYQSQRQYQSHKRAHLFRMINSYQNVISMLCILLLTTLSANIEAQTSQCFQPTEQPSKKQAGKIIQALAIE